MAFNAVYYGQLDGKVELDCYLLTQCREDELEKSEGAYSQMAAIAT